MLNRRAFLAATGTFTLGTVLSGCRNSASADLRVQLLQGSVPAQILQEFQRQFQAGRAAFGASKQLADLFQQLETWQNPDREPASGGLRLPQIGRSQTAPVADVVTLGDFWLADAIQRNLIQPMPLDQLAGWQQLPPAWQQLVRRDRQGQISDSGELWAAPYRWGSLLIAYNVKAMKDLGWTPTDWSDLWRPDLRGYLSLPESPRSVIGLTLKKLGQSVNTADLNSVPSLASELKALNQQVKFYSSTAYLQPLMLQDTWMTVGWSTEILPLVQRDPRIAAVVPRSGTILTADLWVRPATAPAAASKATPDTTQPSTPAFEQWIEFLWKPAIAGQLSVLSLAASPILTSLNRSQLPAKIQQNPLLLPDNEILARSEFLLPLANSDPYRQAWEAMRRTG